MVKTESAQVLKTGTRAPQFELRGTDNKIYSLDRFAKSKALLVIFICNHCPYVKAGINDMINLQSKFDKNDFQIIGINSNDPEYDDEGFENMKAFYERYQLNFPYLIDETQETARSYGAVCTPDPYLFNSDRILVYHGKLNDAAEPNGLVKTHIMEENVRTLLSGGKIENSFDPSIGCSIKWK
ncbi:MAG TPA: thioredoxin family protein [Nitrososphaeraceae archaeon]|jgi:peroxiredoxin